MSKKLAPVADKTPAKTPEIVDDAPPPGAFTPLPTAVTAAKKKTLRGRTVWGIGELYVDRSGTFATDGREDLPLSLDVVRSLLRHYSSDNQGRVYQMILPVKVTIAGTDAAPLLVVLNGRQRLKGIDFINALMVTIHATWQELGKDRVRLKNVLVAQGEAGRNGTGYPEMAWVTAEDAECLVGGRVSGEAVPGLLTKSKDSEEGPMPYCVRVEYVDVDPNSPEALEISLAERISVPTPPTGLARQAQRLLDAGRTGDSVAASMGVEKKTLYNRLLVLHAIKEVQDALDAGQVSWRTLKEMFFRDTRRGGPVAKDPAEQKALLDALLGAGAGAGRAGAAVRAELNKPEGDAAPADAVSETGDPVTAEEPGPAPEALSGNVSPPRAPEGVLRILPRAADEVRSRGLRLPRPDADEADTYWERREAIVQADTASAVMEYLSGQGDALDAYPGLKGIVVESLAQASAEEPAARPASPWGKKGPKAAREMTPEQRLARDLTELFTAWEDAGSEGEWPTAEEAEARRGLGLIQAEYVDALKKAPKPKKGEKAAAPDKGLFAREWVAKNLLGVPL